MAREQRLHARENSTLVFATVAESASLLMLTFALQKPGLSPIWHWIGFIFSLLGPGYREVTVLTIDFLDFKEISEKRYPLWAILPRMLILRFFLYLPIAAWIILLTGQESSWLRTLLIALSAVALSAMVMSAIELLQRNRPYPQKSSTKLEINEGPPSQKGEIEDRCEKVDRLFDIALVLITIFSTIVLSYASVRSDFQNSILDAAQRSMVEVNFSFRVLTIPLVVLIFFWLIRGLVPPNGYIFLPMKMMLRQFCWGFFSILFNLNALIFWYLLFTKNLIELFQFQNWLSFLLFSIINVFAMWNYTICHPTFTFFRSRRRRFVWIVLGSGIAEFVSWFLIFEWIQYVVILT